MSLRIGSPTERQAVILAGGLGTRMRPLTETIPKPMIAVAGKPFLQWQLKLLRDGGMANALLLVAYLGEQIEDYFGNGAKTGGCVEYSYERSPLGTGGALKNAEAKLRDWFVLVNGDTYLAIDYEKLMRDFVDADCKAMIVAYEKPAMVTAEVPASGLPGNLGVSSNGKVTAYRKREPEGLNHIDAGVIVLKKEVLANLSMERKCSLEEEIYPQLIERGEMRAWVTAEPFYDMGSPVGLVALEAKLG
jgi:Nucleoside-diphosphate-sugar pyrophosphorylase involved in lipopolysaccharide biosynthesis/translation initiation factor 2B, gamma/epsilon subunits (eIF-2Bgamma/eIF-2Bepsilon)